MFCPKCGNADQRPESFCRQCGTFLPDFDKLERKEIPPEEHLEANSILTLMSAIVSGTLAILLHAFFSFKSNTPILILITAGVLSAMFFWQVQTFWRTMQLKKQLSKRKKKEKVEAEAIDTNPLIESAKPRELLNESGFSNAVPPSVIENTTKHLGAKKTYE
jgi:uncharacterized membrane protein YvbJ